MLSEEPVQGEGVESLLKLCNTYIPKPQSASLMMKVIQVIMDRIKLQSEQKETEDIKEKAKIAVLQIVQKFSEADIFLKEECTLFLDTFVDDLKADMGFKIKRFLLPALISMTKHLDYDMFKSSVYPVFQTFVTDEIWGTRKAAIDCTADIIHHLKPDESDKLKDCFQFFKRCLYDSNRWVKNQALM